MVCYWSSLANPSAKGFCSLPPHHYGVSIAHFTTLLILWDRNTWKIAGDMQLLLHSSENACLQWPCPLCGLAVLLPGPGDGMHVQDI